MLHALLIEDDPAIACLVGTMLATSRRQAFSMDRAVTLAEGLRRLKEGSFDVILLDLGLPDSAGLKTLDSVAAQAPALPIVVITGKDDEGISIKALTRGAQTYLVKDSLAAGLFTHAIVSAVRMKETAQALRENEEKYRALVENINDIVFAADIHGRLTYVSPVVERVFGYKPEAMVGQPFSRFIYPDDQPLMMERFRALLAGEIRMDDYRVVTRSGDLRWVQSSSRPVIEDGEQVGIQGRITDITERKRAEEKIRMFSRELLAAREGEKKRVSAALHHDVGSLTVGMSAYFDALEQDIRCGKTREALKSAKAARKLFTQSVARLKALAIEFRPPDLDILGLRAAMRQHFSRITEQTGIRVRFTENLGRRRLADNAAVILFRIVQEALTNAVKHGRAKKVDVRLSVSKKAVSLEVCSDGKPFHSTLTRRGSPVHLGLQMMEEMAVSIGGTFTIQSVRNKGTVVVVTLPLVGGGAKRVTRERVKGQVSYTI